MSLTLGEKLRQAREERGISISEIAEQTRISAHYLDCIENDDYRTLPGGIFNKGFVKSYAKYVGISEQEALQDYARLVEQQDGSASDEPKNYKPEVLTDDRTSTGVIPTAIIAVVVLGLMTWGLLKLVDYLQNQPTQSVANSNTAAANGSSGGNTNAANVQQPLPSTDQISVELKSLSDSISVTYWADGKKGTQNVTADAPLTVKPTEEVRISYYRGFTPDKVQLSVNGKTIAAPNAPPKGNIFFVVSKTNIAQVLQSGQVSDSVPAASSNGNTAR
jgi:cytoskeletal protein RodZ